MSFLDVVADVRFEPWVCRSTAATLINELPATLWDLGCLGDKATGFGQLFDVVASIRHRIRDTVRGVGDVKTGLFTLWKGCDRLLQQISIGGDEIRMVVE